MRPSQLISARTSVSASSRSASALAIIPHSLIHFALQVSNKLPLSQPPQCALLHNMWRCRGFYPKSLIIRASSTAVLIFRPAPTYFLCTNPRHFIIFPDFLVVCGAHSNPFAFQRANSLQTSFAADVAAKDNAPFCHMLD